MKFLILVCAVLSTVLAGININLGAAKATARNFKAAEIVCNEDPATTIDFEALIKAHNEGNYGKPAKSGAHALCISKKLRWQKVNGSVDEELFHSTAVFGDTSKLEDFVTKCTQFPGSPEEVAEQLVDCYLIHRPHGPGVY